MSLASRRMFICHHCVVGNVVLGMTAVTGILHETSSRRSNCSLVKESRSRNWGGSRMVTKPKRPSRGLGAFGADFYVEITPPGVRILQTHAQAPIQRPDSGNYR